VTFKALFLPCPPETWTKEQGPGNFWLKGMNKERPGLPAFNFMEVYLLPT